MRAVTRIVAFLLLVPLTLATALADPPRPPQDFEATGGHERVELTWREPADNGGAPIESYRIFRSLDWSAWEEVANLTADARNHTDMGAIACVWNIYELVAYSGEGAGSPAYAYAVPYHDVPCAPRWVSAALEAGPTVRVEWSPPLSNGTDLIDGYVIERATPGHGFEPIGEALRQNATEFVDAHLPDAPNATYRVLAYNDHGSSAPSDPVTVAFSAPSAPRNLSAARVALHVQLAWEPPLSEGTGPVTSYRVYRSIGGSESLLATVSGDDLDHTDTSCALGVGCIYRVSAVNFVGEGPRSNAAKVAT